MKGSYFLDNKTFEVREQVLPELGDNDVLVRNMACGVCGTDAHIYAGEAFADELEPPVVLGHEFSGKVEKVGKAVKGIKSGDKVTIDPNIYCGKCRPCHNGKKHLCENLGAVGVNRDGGFADYCVVPSEQVFVLGDDVDYEAGAMSEPLACCLHGIDQAGIKPGNTVLIVGGGAIGNMMVQLAKMSGAAKVILSEPVAKRREMGEQMGADASFDPFSQDPAKQIKALTGKDGADVIIECAGTMEAVQQAFECAAKGATIVQFSVPPSADTYAINPHDMFKKEITYIGSFVNPYTHARAAELLTSGRINVKPLITHRFGIEDVEKAIHMHLSDESIKVMVVTDI